MKHPLFEMQPAILSLPLSSTLITMRGRKLLCKRVLFAADAFVYSGVKMFNCNLSHHSIILLGDKEQSK